MSPHALLKSGQSLHNNGSPLVKPALFRWLPTPNTSNVKHPALLAPGETLGSHRVISLQNQSREQAGRASRHTPATGSQVISTQMAHNAHRGTWLYTNTHKISIENAENKEKYA